MKELIIVCVDDEEIVLKSLRRELNHTLRSNKYIITVSDTGTGIPQEDIPRLFRIDVKYFHAGTAGEKGTGLGLVLCKGLVERNGGKILVESEAGQGTVVTIRLSAISR